MNKDGNGVNKVGLFADDPPAKIAKTAGGRRKTLVFWGIVLVLLGWFAYNNLSLPSDWTLNETLLHEAEKHPGKTFRLKLKGIYPGEWQKVCFYANYQGREEILRDSGIDIQPTRARVWAGSESAMTFLFIYADGTIHAQRINEGRDFISHGNEGPLESPLASCGKRDSVVEIKANVGKGLSPSLIFHPLGR